MLCWYQRLYDDGLALEDRAIPLLEKAGDPEALGKALIVRAILCDYLGDYDRSIESLRRVCQLLPGIDNPDVTMAAYYNLARTYRKLGQYDRVSEILMQLRQQSEKLNIRTYTIYIDWFEGRVALDHDDIESAIQHLQDARSAFLFIETRTKAGLVGLDLAIAYHARGEEERAVEAASEATLAVDLWRSKIPDAWRKLKRALITRTISREDLIAIRDAVDQCQEDPLNHAYLELSVSAV